MRNLWLNKNTSAKIFPTVPIENDNCGNQTIFRVNKMTQFMNDQKELNSTILAQLIKLNKMLNEHKLICNSGLKQINKLNVFKEKQVSKNINAEHQISDIEEFIAEQKSANINALKQIKMLKDFIAEQKTINGEVLKALDERNKQQPNAEHLLSKIFKKGDRIKIEHGTNSSTGVFIKCNYNVLIWTDDKGALCISNTDHIVVTKL